MDGSTAAMPPSCIPMGTSRSRDRFKDVIISGGENISSVEVEGVFMRHPAIQEVAVVGIPDPKWGETPHAFVVVARGADVTEADSSSMRENTWRTSKPLGKLNSLPNCEDGDRENTEVRLAGWPPRHFGPIGRVALTQPIQSASR